MRRLNIFVDTETTNEKNKVDVGSHTLDVGMAKLVEYESTTSAAIKHQESLLFKKSDEFWQWVTEKVRDNNAINVYAHNWNFDGAILDTIRQLRRLGYIPTKYINGGTPPVIIQFSAAVGRSIHLIDTLNYWRTSLAAMGASVGLKKLDMPDNSNANQWLEYLERDVDILVHSMTKYRQFLLDVGSAHTMPTLAGQTLQIYLSRFAKHDIYVHDRKKSLLLERAAYYGGRVEAFYLGRADSTVYKLDINSMYPSVMRDNYYSIKPKAYYDVDRLGNDVNADFLKRCLDDGLGVAADVLLRTDIDCFPTRHNKKLIFPVGEFRAILSTPDLQKAIDTRSVVNVYRMATYEREEIFRDFVEYFYDLRQKYLRSGDAVFAGMSKIILNSLYGKFGQRAHQWRQIPDLPPGVSAVYNGTQVQRVRQIGKITEGLSREAEGAESVPIIAAEVTAYARQLLYSYVQKVQLGGGSVYYCDTDSLIVDGVGKKILEFDLDQKELGKLKIEEMARDLRIHGPKDYIMNDKKVIKGIRKNAEEFEPGRFRQLKFESWGAKINKGDFSPSIRIENVVKTLGRKPTKRKGAKGWTKPHKLSVGKVAQENRAI